MPEPELETTPGLAPETQPRPQSNRYATAMTKIRLLKRVNSAVGLP